MSDKTRSVSPMKSAFLILVLLLLTSCNVEQAVPASTRSSGQPSPTESTATTTSAVIAIPSDLEQATVSRLVDGDTIHVLIDGQDYRLRYIGVDTPETVDPRRPVECFGKEASERNRQLVEGRTVGLEKDISNTDRFGRLLRYVWVDGRMVNATLVEEGYAHASAYPPDVRYAKLFAALQTEARKAVRGLWGAGC